MKLNRLDTKITKVNYHPYYGTRKNIIYECPCGEGTVIYEEEDVPGNRDWFTMIKCRNCAEKYEIKNHTSSNWSIVKKSKEDK